MYNKEDILEIIVDKDGFCHLYINGEKRKVTYIKFEIDSNDMIPILTTKQILRNSEGEIVYRFKEEKNTQDN